MNVSDFAVRTAQDIVDCERLVSLYDEVFAPEEVGLLARTLFKHHPSSTPEHWYMVEHIATGELAAGFTLIPWHWQWYGREIKTAEQGLVASRQKYQGLGLQRLLNDYFDRVLDENHYDLAIIQGIPGFYQKFGYHYSLAIDNHINLEWRQIPDSKEGELSFRKAGLEDINFLVAEDERTASYFQSSNKRSVEEWQYLLTKSRETDYGSDIWIGERANDSILYARRCFQGFGDGMIVSEASEGIAYEDAIGLLQWFKAQNVDLNKPYLRLNLANSAALSQAAITLGAQPGLPYGFQIKLPSILRWLEHLKPEFTQRLSSTEHAQYSERFRLDFYSEKYDLQFNQGRCVAIKTASGDPMDGACCPADIAPSLLLGRHDWRTLRLTRPDIIAQNPRSESLLSHLFPEIRSWHHLPY